MIDRFELICSPDQLGRTACADFGRDPTLVDQRRLSVSLRVFYAVILYRREIAVEIPRAPYAGRSFHLPSVKSGMSSLLPPASIDRADSSTSELQEAQA